MHEQARTILKVDVKNDLRRMGISGLNGSATFQNKATFWKDIH